MGTVIEMIPNAFWSALNNQNLVDLLPPRWSILVNDAGVQVSSRNFNIYVFFIWTWAVFYYYVFSDII